ncbi:hypothetical protein UT300016_34450 [Clostridium senegalense]
MVITTHFVPSNAKRTFLYKFAKQIIFIDLKESGCHFTPKFLIHNS